jgi:hypothetical protein
LSLKWSFPPHGATLFILGSPRNNPRRGESK